MLEGLEIIENEYLPENVSLFCDLKFFYWVNNDTGVVSKIPKVGIFDLSELCKSTQPVRPEPQPIPNEPVEPEPLEKSDRPPKRAKGSKHGNGNLSGCKHCYCINHGYGGLKCCKCGSNY